MFKGQRSTPSTRARVTGVLLTRASASVRGIGKSSRSHQLEMPFVGSPWRSSG